MPMYEYRCKECDVVFEAINKLEDRLLGSKCPDCSGWGDYLISAPFLKAYIDSDRWNKNRESHMRKERKNMSNHGTYES